MILLQVTAETAATWRTYLQDGNQIAQIVGIIMVVIYVVYTYKTFRQIKKQTDYQQDAYLKVESVIVKEITVQDNSFVMLGGRRIVHAKKNLLTKYLNKEIPAKMSEILKPIFKFADNLFEGNFFAVNLTNYGNAEVNLIKLNLSVTILISEEVAEKKMLKEKDTHFLKIEIPEIVERNGGKLKIPLISTASFPIYSIILNGEYFDVRNKKYVIPEITTSGQNEHFHKLPKQSTSAKRVAADHAEE